MTAKFWRHLLQNFPIGEAIYFFFSLKYNLLFRWGPAHVGIKGNEAADKAIKQTCYLLNSPVSYSDIKQTVNSFIRQKWQREWHVQTENELNEIKPCIAMWSTFIP